MNIKAKITGIKYLPMLVEELDEIDIKDFCVNEAPSSFALVDKRTKLAVSKWVSPKRTRSYPYERVYNTLIPRLIRLTEAPSHGKPIVAYDPMSRGTEAYLNLAKEVIEHNERREQ